MNLLLVTLAAAPVSFSSLVQRSDQIVIAKVVAVTRTPRVLSKLAVELTVRGRALPELEVPEALEIGERGLFLLGREKTQVLFLTPRHPGLFVYSPTRVVMDGALARSARELPWPSGVPVSEVLAALGKPDVTIARERGFRVISTTCNGCDLERALAKQLAGLERPVECAATSAESCVTAAWKARRPVILRQDRAGIDSGGKEVFFGPERSLSRAWFDLDVTGGTQPQCSSAVFVTACPRPRWEKRDESRELVCDSAKAVPLCHEWDSRNEELGPLRPLSELDERAETSHCRAHRDGRLSCRPAW